MVSNINGKPAIRIAGKVKKRLDKAALIDCDGDEQWFPNGTFRENRAEGTVDIQEWIFRNKFPRG